MIPGVLNGKRNLKMDDLIIAHLLDKKEDHH